MENTDLILCESDKDHYIKILDKYFTIYQQYLIPLVDKMNSDFAEMQIKDISYDLDDVADLFVSAENSFIASWICLEYQKWQHSVYLFISHDKLLEGYDVEECVENEIRGGVQPILIKYGIEVDKFKSWKNIHEMGLVVNTIKHFTGRSYNDLKKIRPDFFKLFNEFDIKRMAVGTGDFVLNLTSNDYLSYHKALIGFWNELYIATNGSEF